MRVFHGDHQLASREALYKVREELKAKGLEVISLSDKAIDLSEVKQVIEASSLFGSDRFLIVEGLFTGSVSNAKKEVTQYFKQYRPNNVLIWEGKKVDGRRLNGFEAEEFKINSKVFALLEAIRPGKQRIFLPLLDEVLKVEAVELVFFLLVRQTRQLIEVIDGGGKGPSWLVNKLRNQAADFGLERLLKFHESLYQLELETKTGSSPLPLQIRLELSLINL